MTDPLAQDIPIPNKWWSQTSRRPSARYECHVLVLLWVYTSTSTKGNVRIGCSSGVYRYPHLCQSSGLCDHP